MGGMGWDGIDWLIGDFEYALKVIYDSKKKTPVCNLNQDHWVMVISSDNYNILNIFIDHSAAMMIRINYIYIHIYIYYLYISIYV